MIRRLTITLVLGTLMATFGGTLVAAAEPDPQRHLTVEKWLDMEYVDSPQISPDGRQIVYSRSWVDRWEDRYGAALWIMEADGTRARYLCEGSGAVWSPDGTRIAYTHADEAGRTQIFVRWMDAEGSTSQVTRLVETPRGIVWSPGSDRLAFVMLTPPEDRWTVDLPASPEGASWTEGPRVIDRMHYRQDRRGFLDDGFVHLFVVPAEGGTPRQLTRGEWHVGARPFGLDYGASLSWSPDGEQIVIDGNQDPDADLKYRESHLYVVTVATGKIRPLTTERGPWQEPLVSPDGRRVAYTGFRWTGQTYHVDQLWVIDMEGEPEARLLTGELDRSPQQLHWAPDGKGVFFTAQDEGARHLYRVSLSGEVRQLTTGRQQLSLSSLNARGEAAGVLRTVAEPGTVVQFRASKPGELKPLTAVNADVLGPLALSEVEELWYDSTDGARVQGWLVRPPDFDPTQRYPLILHIHGGPHAMYGNTFNFSFQHLAAHGYLVLYTNPRGSSGYGTAFGNAIDDSYPSVDFADLMAGVDLVIARGYVDTDRLYVTGVSGGGVLSSWTVAHTDRFAAAAVRAPVINWISFAGTTDITAWGFFRYHKPFWEDPGRWLEHSPLMHVHKVKTPVLLMTGELDLRTPMGQTEEYYQALKTLGVETVLLRFAGEYHGTGHKPSNFMRTQLYLLDWFAQHPPATPESTE